MQTCRRLQYCGNATALALPRALVALPTTPGHGRQLKRPLPISTKTSNNFVTVL